PGIFTRHEEEAGPGGGPVAQPGPVVPRRALRGGGCRDIASDSRSPGRLRGPGIHGLSDLARAGNRRKTLLSRGHHRQGSIGRGSFVGSHPSGEFPGRSFSEESRSRPRGGAETQLAGGECPVNGHLLRAFLWLHWRLRLNQVKRGGTVNAVILALLAIG